MASVSPELAEQQFKAVASMRWVMAKHSLKNLSGKLNAVARVITVLVYAVVGLIAALGCGAIAYTTTKNQIPEVLAGVMWFLTGFWQLFPLLRAGYSNTFDPSTLLRFPLTYRTYFLLRLFYGALEPVALVGVLGLIGATLGVTLAAPQLLAWCAVAMATIVLLNVLLTQLLLSWVERWLAQRRTREIFGIVFFLLMISLQFIGPITQRWSQSHRRDRNAPPPISRKAAMRAVSVERALPPGLAGYALAEAQKKEYLQATASLAGLGLYVAGIVFLLDLRLKRQYRGENLSESARPIEVTSNKSVRAGWAIPGLPGASAAIFEKEVRYLLRSGPMLMSFIMPLVVLLIFGGTSNKQLPSQISGFTFPLAAAYSLLILTNVVYNTFGGDHAGIQFYFLSPVRLRGVIAAKNVVHAGIFVTEIALLWFAVSALRTAPSPTVTAMTLLAIPYALALEFSAGNLMSVFTPKKLEFQMMGRQRTPQLSALLALLVHAVVVGSCVLVFWIAMRHGVTIAMLSFLLLDCCGGALYVFTLKMAERLALTRRESMYEALCRE